MDTDTSGVARRCRAARLAAGLSQPAAAQGLDGVSSAYISRIETGDRQPSVTVLRELAGRYGVSVSWLETGRDVVELELSRELAERLHAAGIAGELKDAIDKALATSVPA